VTVRFETADTPAGPVRTFAVDDPMLSKLATPTDDEPVIDHNGPGE
jgi:DNA polymerase-4